jgi:hypothetical protein
MGRVAGSREGLAGGGEGLSGGGGRVARGGEGGGRWGYLVFIFRDISDFSFFRDI